MNHHNEGREIFLNKHLIKKAKEVRKQAYTPYSKFKVGAALLAKSGKIYTGCNIENAAYPVSCCAERVAIFNAISAGENSFSEMVVVANTTGPVSPCGSCRQVMSEFFNKEMIIHLTNLQGETKTVTIEQLLPFLFEQKDLT